MSKTRQTFTASVDAWVKVNESWLTDDDLPAVTALRAMAEALDAELTATMLSQYGLFFRALEKKRPASGEDDELELLLRDDGD